MRKRFRQHVNPLKMSALAPRPGPLELPDGPIIEAELGCGDARFLLARAQELPDQLFVGIDIREEFLAWARRDLEQLGLENVRLEVSNLIVDADRLFPPDRVRRFFINFPDPWFKARQHNRRWLSAETLPHLVRALAPGGEIFFQSDVWMLALEALGLLEADERLANLAGPWSFTPGNPFGVRSTREQACEDEGRPIWRLHFQSEKLPDAEEPWD